MIAHAMGGIERKTYSNSQEAFLLNYKQGCRWFEVDLHATDQGDLVALHWLGEKQRAGLGKSFTLEEFRSVKVWGKYTPLDAERIAALMHRHPEWVLVSDMRGGFSEGHRLLCAELLKNGLDCSARVVPQAYNLDEDLTITKAMGFRRIILTLYRTKAGDDEVVRAVKNDERIIAVTMNTRRFSEALAGRLARLGVRTYVHTLNGARAIERYRQRGAFGVYTDFDCKDG